MKKIWYAIVIHLFIICFSVLNAQNISPQFSELSGMEDIQGNTHLLYRIYSHNGGPIYDSGRNDIYNFIPEISTDTIFLQDSYSCGIIPFGQTVQAYTYWDQDLSKYIYAGDMVTCFEPAPFISRFDSNFVYSDWFNITTDLIISKQNDSLVFALPKLISYDGGFNWDTLKIDYQLISVAPFDDKTYFLFGFTTSNNTAIYKSTDRGNSYAVVDTGSNFWDTKFYYDSNGQHIYMRNAQAYPSYELKVSSEQGNAFTWKTIYLSRKPLLVSLDQSQSGVIYLADGKKLLLSTDYGNTLTLYKNLDKNIIGIYKKPNSNKLYAESKYKIYEITDDVITVVKSLPIPQEILAFYPLAVGNKWIYDYLFVDWNSIGYQDIFVREVQSSEVKPNGKEYFKIREKYVQTGFESIVYERIDSIEGKVYRYNEYCPNSEEFIEDLVMDVGDSTYAARFGYCIEHPPTELLSEQYFNNWGIEGNRRNYRYVGLVTADYFLSNDIGLDYFRLDDDNGWKDFALKGMLKNGIVYGDTILTDVNDENELTKVFSLSQNYPNPFNPSTTINYIIKDRQFVSLKVYDVLGKEVATIVNEEKPAGTYEVKFDASLLPSGIYFYRIQAGSFVESNKMILLK